MLLALKGFGLVVVAWVLAAYLFLPGLWKHYEHQPGAGGRAQVSTTAAGHPRRPAQRRPDRGRGRRRPPMLDAGWDPADPVTFRTSLRIARSVLRRKPYPEAPVSNLFVFGRKQDLAFEKADGRSASRRHHVRFWKSADLGRGGVPLWCGAVTFDRGVGLSHPTGQITHHIDPDVDAERDGLIADLRRPAGSPRSTRSPASAPPCSAVTAAATSTFTDGELTIGVLAAAGSRDEPPRRLDNPAVVRSRSALVGDPTLAPVAPGPVLGAAPGPAPPCGRTTDGP